MFFSRFLILAMFMMLIFSIQSFADSLGFTFNQIIDDRSLGLTGDYDTRFRRVDFSIDGQLALGDVHRGVVNTEFVFDVAAVDLKLLINTKLKGHALTELGRENVSILAFTLPIDAYNFDIGIGGTNASPFAPPNALDDLTAKGYSADVLEPLGLADINPKPKGLPFKNGSALNAYIATGFEKADVDIDVRGLIELLGEGDRLHQINTVFKTNRVIFENVVAAVGLEVGLAFYAQEVHWETAVISSFAYRF